MYKMLSFFHDFAKTVTHLIGRRDDGTISHHGQDPIIQTKQFILVFYGRVRDMAGLGHQQKGQLVSIKMTE